MKLIYAYALVTLSNSSMAAPPEKFPSPFFCRASGGEPLVANREFGQIALCKFDKAYISLDTLNKYAIQGVSSKATTAYIKITEPIKSNFLRACDAHDAAWEFVTIDEKSEILCFFSDGSAMEWQTLDKGISSEENAGLNKALQIQRSRGL